MLDEANDFATTAVRLGVSLADMRRLPPLNAVKAFEAAARLSSVTAAAEELRVSHSAVSQQIKQLEDWFGQKLFSRPGRRIEPTAAALSYLEDVRAALDRIALASEQLANRGSRRVLTINCTPSFALRWLIPRTARLSDRQSDAAASGHNIQPRWISAPRRALRHRGAARTDGSRRVPV